MERIGPGQMRIGEALVAARTRAGLEIADVEQQTRIRAKYLRALENEAWDELPSPAYAKGYLRSYAELVGLDAETLVDEYRRQAEGGEAGGTRRANGQGTAPARPLGGPPRAPRRWLPVAAVLVGVIGALVVIGVLSGDDGGSDRSGAAKRHGKGEHRRHDRQTAEAPAGSVRLRLAVHEPVEICLLGEHRQELIDGQVVAAGSRDEYAAKHFQLRFPTGFKPKQLDVELDGKPRRLPRVHGPAAFRVSAADGIRQAPRPERSCP